MTYDVIITQENQAIIAKDRNGFAFAIGVVGQDDFTVILKALQYLSNGGILFFGFGTYSISSGVINVPEGVIIQGSGFDQREQQNPTETRFWFYNGGMIILNNYCKLDQITLSFDAKTDSTNCLWIKGSNVIIGTVVLWGSFTNPLVQFGDGNTIVSACSIHELYINGGSPALVLNHVTQCLFGFISISGCKNTGLLMDRTDNVTFMKLLITSMANVGTLLQLGNGGYCYGNHFTYIDLTNIQNGNSIVINYKINPVNGENVNYIVNLVPEGNLTVVHNNGATQSLYGFNSLTVVTGYI